MARYHVPGAAVGVFHRGREHVRGYGITDVDDPSPVDGNTLFRIASTTKTFTGAVVMRLVEQGRLDLNATVRRYLPDFRVADAVASERVTLSCASSCSIRSGSKPPGSSPISFPATRLRAATSSTTVGRSIYPTAGISRATHTRTEA